MIEELQILKQIAGDLTGLGIWFVVLFFSYKLSWVAVFSGAVVAIYKLCIKVFCCDVSKDEFEAMKAEHKREISNKVDELIAMKKVVADSQAETDRVLHMYSILKEQNK